MKWYYPTTGKQTATTNFTRIFIGFKAANLIIQNSSSSDGDLEISFDGTNTHFHLERGEPLNLGSLEFSEIWIKKTSGTVTYRIAAYAK